MSQPLNFVILTSGMIDSMSFQRMLSEEPRIRVVAASDHPEQVYADVVRWRPAAVIVNPGLGAEPDWTLCRQISAVCSDTVIICTADHSSPEMILDSLRAGAREFLRMPFDANELRTVVSRVAQISGVEANASRKRGRVIAVYSNKGGCGTSFIASNLAAALRQPTALADLNLQAPTQDLLFGVKAKYSIADLVQHRVRLDDRLLDGMLVEYSPNLSLLTAPLEAEAAEDVRSEHVVEIIGRLRDRHDFVVLDLPHTFDANTIAALDQADEVLLVLTLDILAARSAQRALAIFRRLGYPNEKVRLVLNRWSKQSDLELRHLERFLGERITHFISEDYATVVNSINLGKPLVETHSSPTIVAELKRLAEVHGRKAKSEPESQRTLFDSVFGSVRRQTGRLMARKPASLSIARP
jgi:pilus assembly protein CpaE